MDTWQLACQDGAELAVHRNALWPGMVLWQAVPLVTTTRVQNRLPLESGFMLLRAMSQIHV